MSGLHIHKKTEFHLVRWASLVVFTAMLAAAGFFTYKWYDSGILPAFMPIASADPAVDERPIDDSERKEHDVASDVPAYLAIPKIGIDDARIMSVGVNENKLIAHPKNIHDAGWYEKSAKPGADVGAVVIAGSARGMTKDGVFARVTDLEVGDAIDIKTGDDMSHGYSVMSVETMDLDVFNQQATDQLSKSINPAKQGLNIVTNAGNWVPKLGVYDKRIVIRAVATR